MTHHSLEWVFHHVFKLQHYAMGHHSVSKLGLAFGSVLKSSWTFEHMLHFILLFVVFLWLSIALKAVV